MDWCWKIKGTIVNKNNNTGKSNCKNTSIFQIDIASDHIETTSQKIIV